MLLSMVIFGTIGLVVREIPLSSPCIALARGIIGLLFICCAAKKKPDFRAMRRNLPILCASGVTLGLNWVLLFEAYRFTTVATATLCYYCAPTLVILGAALLLGEKPSGKHIVCAAVTAIGMVLVSGVAEKGNTVSAKGIAFGLAAALFYAATVLLNKKLKQISVPDRTIAQLFVSSLVLTPYVAITGMGMGEWSVKATVCLLTVGIVHTGIAYLLCFGAMEKLPARSFALLSYLDPVIAVILSAAVLREPMGIGGAIGAVLIIGAAAAGEIGNEKKKTGT